MKKTTENKKDLIRGRRANDIICDEYSTITDLDCIKEQIYGIKGKETNTESKTTDKST